MRCLHQFPVFLLLSIEVFAGHTDEEATPEEILSSHPNSYVLHDPEAQGHGTPPSFAFHKHVELPEHLQKENEITKLKIDKLLSEQKEHQRMVEDTVREVREKFGFGTFGHKGYKNTFNYGPIDLGTYKAIDFGTSFGDVKGDPSKLKLPLQRVTVTKTVGVPIPQPYPIHVKEEVPIHIPQPVPVPVQVTPAPHYSTPQQTVEVHVTPAPHQSGPQDVYIQQATHQADDYAPLSHLVAPQPQQHFSVADHLRQQLEEGNRELHQQQQQYEEEQLQQQHALQVQHDRVAHISFTTEYPEVYNNQQNFESQPADSSYLGTLVENIHQHAPQVREDHNHGKRHVDRRRFEDRLEFPGHFVMYH